MEGVNPFVFTAPARDADVEITVKHSRFIGSVRRVLTVDVANGFINKGVPALYPKANHHCWAYRIGSSCVHEHCSDAGEPAGTAGRPILGMLRRHALCNTLIVVTRYFGGIKLGIRGLIDAYGESAEQAVAEAGTEEMELNNTLDISCGYKYSKTLATTLRKWGFGRDRRKVNYGVSVDIHLEVPCSMREKMALSLEEMRARGFLTEMVWGDAPLIRKRWR